MTGWYDPPRFRDKYARDMEAKWALEKRAFEIFKLIVAEWKSDPQSVQCFDLRIVHEAIKIDEAMKRLPSDI